MYKENNSNILVRKNMKNQYLIYSLLIFALSFAKLNGQTAATSTVQIKDLVLIPDVALNQSDTAHFNSKLMFKLFPASDVNTIYIQLGSTVNSSNILNTLANVTHQGSNDNVIYNGPTPTYPIVRYTVNIPFQILRSQLTKPTYLTVFIQDASGNFSTKLNYSFNQ